MINHLSKPKWGTGFLSKMQIPVHESGSLGCPLDDWGWSHSTFSVIISKQEREACFGKADKSLVIFIWTWSFLSDPPTHTHRDTCQQTHIHQYTHTRTHISFLNTTHVHCWQLCKHGNEKITNWTSRRRSHHPSKLSSLFMTHKPLWPSVMLYCLYLY